MSLGFLSRVVRKKAVCFHRSVAENQWSLNSALRAVDLEDRALGLSPGKPGFKPAADISRGRPNLKMGQAHSDPLAEPATVYREECDFPPQCQVSHSPCYVWSTMAGAFLWDEVCPPFWSVSWGGFWFCPAALFYISCFVSWHWSKTFMFHSVHWYSFSGEKRVSVSALLIGRHSCLSCDTGLSSLCGTGHLVHVSYTVSEFISQSIYYCCQVVLCS